MKKFMKKIYAYLENENGEITYGHGKFFFNSRNLSRELFKNKIFSVFPILAFQSHVIIGKTVDGVNVILGTYLEYANFFNAHSYSRFITITARLCPGEYLTEDVVVSGTLNYPESGGKTFRVNAMGYSSFEAFENSVLNAFPSLSNYPGFTMTWLNSLKQVMPLDNDDALSFFLAHEFGQRHIFIFPKPHDGSAAGYSFEACLQYPGKETRKFFLSQEEAGSFLKLKMQLVRLFPALVHCSDFEISWRMLDGRKVSLGSDEELARYLQEHQGDKCLDIRANFCRETALDVYEDNIASLAPTASSTPRSNDESAGGRSFEKKFVRLMNAGFHNKQNWLKDLFAQNGYNFQATFETISDICLQMRPICKKRKAA